MLSELIRKVYDSPAARVFFMASALIGIVAFCLDHGLWNHSAHAPAQARATHHGVLTPPAQATKVATVIPAPKTTIQSSSGDQSPNVTDVRRDVAIRYGAAAVKTNVNTSQSTSRPAPPRVTSGTVVQVAHGSQSPNINDVGRSVSLDYSATASSSQGVPQ